MNFDKIVFLNKLSEKYPVALVFVSLIASLIPFFIPDLFVFEFVSFIPLLFINVKLKKQLLFGLIFGFIYQAVLISFLYEPIHIHAEIPLIYTTVLIALLALYLSLYWVLFFVSIKIFRKRLYIIPVIGAILEILRDHILTGVPIFDLYLTQFQNIALINYAHFSSYIITFLLFMLNVLIYLSITKKPIYIAAVIALFVFGYLIPANKVSIKPMTILAVTENIPQDQRWDDNIHDDIVNSYIDRTEKLSKRFNPDLVVWPEAAIPTIWNEDTQDMKRLVNFANRLKSPIITGMLSHDAAGYSNSAFLFNHNKIKQYKKIHLVPFGEYLPVRSVFDSIVNATQSGQDLIAGNTIKVFDISGNKIAVPICYETMFPLLMKKFKEKGADIALNITNDGWFSHTYAPLFFARILRFRAIENAIYILRVSNDGVTELFDYNGKIIKPAYHGRDYYLFRIDEN